MDKCYFDINLVIVSKLKLPVGLLKVYFDINLDIVSKLRDIFMVVVSIMCFHYNNYIMIQL
jgi:hypothetical protein